MDAIVLKAPAKVNLALEVCGRRPDGYHELDMLMQAVTLYETVELRRCPGRGVQGLRCLDEAGGPAPGVPQDKRNLAWRAAETFFEAAGLAGGVQLTVHKAVPAQAGMAGGSADAAGVLAGLNLLFNTHFSHRELAELGAALGSDVPFCLAGGTARVRGRGERVQPVPDLPDCRLVAVMPAAGSSTPEGFARYDAAGSSLHPDIGAVLEALAAGDLPLLAARMGNALQQACAGPDTETILENLRAAGALAAQLTGTGAVTYGLFGDGARAAAAAEALRARFERVYLLGPEKRGPFVVPEDE